MEHDSTMLIAGLTSLFAVSLLFLSIFVASEGGGGGGGGGLRKGRGLFKTGNPSLDGRSSTQGLPRGRVDVPATIEVARHGVDGSAEA